MSVQLSDFIPTKAVDVVGVYDVEFNQLFQEARPIKATINEEATFFKHPLESSATRTDHIIFNPVEIGLQVIVSGNDYRNTYQEVKQLYRDQAQLIVKTKADTYENMYIQGIPHDEDPGLFDAVVINITLLETQLAETEVTFLPADDGDTDTVDRGEQEPQTPSESQSNRGTVLSRVFGGAF